MRAPSTKSLNDEDSSEFDDEQDEEFSQDNDSLLDEEESRPFPFTEDLQQHFHPVS